jgi:uncharacterized membrane protein YfcA
MDFTQLMIVVIIGSLVSALTGLGGGSFILASLLFFFPPSYALPLHGLTQLIINLMRTGIFINKVQWKIVMLFSSLMLPASWLAARIFDQINPGVLKILVGSLILLSFVPFPFFSNLIPGKKIFLLMGGISGFVSIFIGVTGPMVMPFFTRLKLSRDEMLSTKSAGQAFLQLSKIIAFWGATRIDFDSIIQAFPLIFVGVLIGVVLSIPLGKRIPDPKFNMIINLMLMIIALKTLLEGLREI